MSKQINWLALALLLSGCATGGMKVEWLSEKDKETVNGLRVQAPVPHKVYAVLESSAGKRVIQEASMSLPSKTEFYDVGYKGGKFNSAVLSLSIHPTGGVGEYSLTTKKMAAETMEAAAEAVNNLSAARLAIREADKPPEPLTPPSDIAVQQAENDLAMLQIIGRMLEENRIAMENNQPLPWPGILGLSSNDD